MNKNRYWNQNMDIRNRGGFNRGGRGGNRGWGWNRGGFNGPNFNFDGFQGGHRFPPPNRATNHWKKRQQKREKKNSPGKRLTEDLIGVTEYISEHEGFNGIIKSRYSDFQVSEMNEKGEFAKLTTTKPPTPVVEAVDEDEDLLLNKYNLEILPMETWDKINSLTLTTGKEAAGDNVEIDMTGVTKEQRTKIHDAVKKAFGDSIVGSTINVGDKKFMRFQKYRKGVRIDNRVKWTWPDEYVYFVVHKQNCDTMDAAVRIAEKLGLYVKPSTIGYAGTKDRRAKTSQWFSVKRIDPGRIANACKHIRDIYVGNFSFGDCNLKLGMLKGNKFRIALRNVTADEETIDEACRNLQEKGFINYYGLQRFGSRIDTPTYDIGLKMLQGKYREAIELILEPREGPLEHALRAYKTSGAVAAMSQLPWRTPTTTHSEVRLIKSLAEAPNDLIGALSKLARNIRLLYLHSYQSLVWNRAVSERIRRFGLNPVVGDCVPLSNIEIEAGIIDDSDSEHDEDEDKDEGDEEVADGEDEIQNEADEKVRNVEEIDSKVEVENDTMDEGVKVTAGEEVDETKVEENEESKGEGDSDNKSAEKSNDKKSNKKKKDLPKPLVPVKVLTQEDVDSGQYTLFNVVMPLPGAFVVYPPNMVDYYEELLTKDGLKMDMKHKVKSYNMSGAYRHIVVRPLGVEWRHVRYSDPFADLIMSDRDEMENRPLTGLVEDGKYRALLLTMTLPSSCYATMALRELLKVDTSSDNQALQNNYHKKKEKNSSSETTDKSEEDKVKAEDNSESDDKKNEETESGVLKNETEKMENESEENVVDNESGEKRKLDVDVEDSVKKVKTE